MIPVIHQGAARVEMDAAHPGGRAAVSALGLGMNNLPGLDAPGAVETLHHPEHLFPTVVLTDGFFGGLDQIAFLLITGR